MVQCGDDFTIAATSENALYYWGTRRSHSNRHATVPKTGVAEIKPTRLETIPSVSHGLDLDEEVTENRANTFAGDIREPEVLRKTSGAKPVAFVHPFGLSDSAIADKEGERSRNSSASGRRKSIISTISGPRLATVSEQSAEPATSGQVVPDTGSTESEMLTSSNR